MNNNLAVEMTLFLLVGTFAAGIVYVVVPLRGLARQAPHRRVARPLAYFSAIGIGFMLIEISEMQRLMVFLGHPVYGLGVVLFTLLLFSGLGRITVSECGPPTPALGLLARRRAPRHVASRRRADPGDHRRHQSRGN